LIGVRLEEVKREEGGTFQATLEIEYGGRRFKLTLCKLARKPSQVQVKEKGDHVVVELIDQAGKGFASCPIHKARLEAGCLECPLMLPPG